MDEKTISAAENNMNKQPAVPLNTVSTDNPNNLANPYGWNVVDASRGETYFNAPQSNSTMVSDCVEMTKRLKAFVPASSVKQGRTPQNNLGYSQSAEEVNIGATYKSFFQ